MGKADSADIRIGDTVRIVSVPQDSPSLLRVGDTAVVKDIIDILSIDTYVGLYEDNSMYWRLNNLEVVRYSFDGLEELL